MADLKRNKDKQEEIIVPETPKEGSEKLVKKNTVELTHENADLLTVKMLEMINNNLMLVLKELRVKNG